MAKNRKRKVAFEKYKKREGPKPGSLKVWSVYPWGNGHCIVLVSNIKTRYLLVISIDLKRKVHILHP